MDYRIGDAVRRSPYDGSAPMKVDGFKIVAVGRSGVECAVICDGKPFPPGEIELIPERPVAEAILIDAEPETMPALSEPKKSRR